MVRFEVFTETMDRRRDMVVRVDVTTWVDVADVFSVRADDDPAWSVITFRPGAGPRSLIVKGTAEAVASLVAAERRRERRPVRRARA